MKQFFFFFLVCLSVSSFAQSYDTPPFNFDRVMNRPYVDSLLRATQNRIRSLDRLPHSARVDTARLELTHFLGYVHYSGLYSRDSALTVSSRLVRMARQLRNVKYQIKGLLTIERYHRAHKIDYPQAIRLNYQILSLIETSPQTFAPYYWRIYRNLGAVNNTIGEHAEATSNFQKSLIFFDKDSKSDPIHRVDLHQSLANSLRNQNQLAEAETHCLIAWELLQKTNASLSSKAYLTNEIGRLYISQRKPDQAIPYLKKSVDYWGKLNAPITQADALADLAEAYANLGDFGQAIVHANDALSKNNKVFTPTLTAYSVLIRAYEHQQDWQKAFVYQRLYNAKKEEEQKAINERESLRSQAKQEREQLERHHRQEQLLQNERYQLLAKQAEIDHLNGINRSNEFLRLTQTNALKHQLESGQIRASAQQKQARQQAVIKQLNIDQLRLGLQAQSRLRNQLAVGLGIISLLGVLLLYYSLRLRRTNKTLLAKNREIEMALLRGQTLERKRVATELHDRVSSLLGATKMTFQTIDSDTLPPRARQLYESSLHLLDDVATQVRQLSHNLVPEQLLQQELAVSLGELVRKLNIARKTSFTLTGALDRPLPLTPDAKFHLYIICLELCTNIIRHARATQAQIKLVDNGNWLAIQLNDNGVGMSATATEGMGLQNMRERAEAIGAQFWFESSVEEGTEARLLLPLP